MNNDLISRSELKKAIQEYTHTLCHDDRPDLDYEYIDIDDLNYVIDNASTVEVPENQVNCVLTMFGECSYNKTGCSDCEIKDRIRKVLENERPQGEWVGNAFDEHHCNRCGHPALWEEEPDGYYGVQSRFCSNCGADMRGEEYNESKN